jgi:hypothetical protein
MKDKASKVSKKQQWASRDAPPAPARLSPSSPQFTCEVCSRTMSDGARQHHLSSETHNRNVRFQDRQKLRKIRNELQKQATIATVEVKRNMWTCSVCCLTMNVSSMESHTAGSPHADALLASMSGKRHPDGNQMLRVDQVAAMYGPEMDIPLRAYASVGFLPSDMVSVGDLWRVIDRWDGEVDKADIK